MPRKHVLAVLPHVIPSTTISVIKPLTALERAGKITLDLALEYAVSESRVARADVVVFCRNVEPKYARPWHIALGMGKPIIYDLDDNLFELPLSGPGAQQERSPEPMNQLRMYLESATLIRVYAEHLKNRVAEFNTQVERVEGPLDWGLVSRPPSKTKPDARVKIVYATSRIEDELSTVFLDDVERLLKVCPDRVEFYFWGCRSDRLARFPSVHQLSFVTNYDRFFRQFSRFGFDIGLAPLLADDFHLCKSNNKFREYAACRIAGIYSNVPVYTECVQHGATGWLIENRPGTWFEAITHLMDNAALRNRIQDNAEQYAREHYGEEKFCAVWLRQIQTAAEAPARSLSGSQIPVSVSTVPAASQALPRLIARFLFRNLRTHGLRATIRSTQWLLNDLPILIGSRWVL